VDDGLVQAALTRARLKRVAGIAGAVLCIVAVALLVRRGIALGDSLGEQLQRIPAATFALALGLYVGGGLLLAAGWVLLVRLASAAGPRAAPLFVGHLRAQLAKYLPGNVFHLAYRHIAARREGVGHRALALALVLESVLVIAAGAILGLGVASDPRLDALAPWARQLVWVAPVLALLAWVGVGVVGRRGGFAQLAPARTAPLFFAVLALDLAFFVLAALALRMLCEQPSALPFAAWCGWLALAWALGYVTPGAPAGIGLREAVLALGLAPVLGEAGALALALAYRLLTLVADAVLALAGFAMLRGSIARSPTEESP
jgi:hypothetical protein